MMMRTPHDLHVSQTGNDSVFDKGGSPGHVPTQIAPRDRLANFLKVFGFAGASGDLKV
jgi:hypothetical protein